MNGEATNMDANPIGGDADNQTSVPSIKKVPSAPDIFVKSITFNDSAAIIMEPGDIIVIVGANNCGKSQSLVDIQNCIRDTNPGVVVKKVEINCPDKLADYSAYFEDRFNTQMNGGNTFYTGVGFRVASWTFGSAGAKNGLRDVSGVFVRRLSTSERLSICNPPDSVNVDDTPAHPIHLLARDPAFRKKVTRRFKEAFGCELIPDVMFGRTVPLRCVDDVPNMTGRESEDEISRQEEFYKKLRKFPELDKQGDGMRGFAGVLLNLIMDYVRVFLIDEPESFLHPPQARMMGNLIGEVIGDKQQVFIATHSEEIIRGLIQACPDRVKVVRLNRVDNKNYAATLDSKAFANVWGDPILRYSNIMAGMFHTKTVVCESDSDCQFYSAIDAHLKQKEGRHPEALYVYSGGKSRFAVVARALRALKIDYKIVGDIDLLNDEEYFKGLVDAIGLPWEDIEADYARLASNLRVPRDKIVRAEAKSLINKIIDGGSEIHLSRKEIVGVKEVVKIETKWDLLKHGGISVIPPGEPTQSWKTLNSKLMSHGLYLLPVGELENFVKDVGGLHGPGWVTKVLSDYQDLDDSVYSQVSEFVRGLGV